VDAAILFSDILTPVEPMGLKLDFVPGPVFENPVRSMADVAALRIPEMEEDVPYVLETIRILRRELEGRVPLIGFGGAPFTLACYMVEGKGSKFRQHQTDDVLRSSLCRTDGYDNRHAHRVLEGADCGWCRRSGVRHLGRCSFAERL
jgi:uroporphyrinogen-III decarboxylase